MTQAMSDASRRISRYFLLQVAVNVVLRSIVCVALYFIGLPHCLPLRSPRRRSAASSLTSERPIAALTPTAALARRLSWMAPIRRNLRRLRPA